MPRKKSQTLTDAELKVMEVLWEQGPATVRAVTDALARQRPVAYTTVLTMLRILDEKGYVDHEKQGRAHVYRPLVGREEARSSVIKHLLSRFFNNSPALLVQNLLQDEDIDPGELRRLKAEIERSDAEDERHDDR